ncbi:hypothetical protein L1F30_11895 [Simiduia sp. 21SJ11W-1]|uniref:hypothetical protein n=1 Tax=Simiduia sp. 21SJ11W-1 TaxID=2909669 RepID=UPI00209F3ECD|nr:hypothetical protein [Simiduia sp. 21SJ11W-1]UTA46863.1 hypothetical protein L1F30_11895 [Simiduia sp. 21SJ11W-1]
MPQLPSGRHVALDPAPLRSLIDKILDEESVTIWPLLAIQKPIDCLQHLEVIYLVPDQGEALQLAPGSLPLDANLQKQPTGLKPRDVLHPDFNWPREDKLAFANYLQGPRVAAYLEKQFERVMEVKQALKEHGTGLEQWEVHTWEAGVHPVQENS